MYKKHANRVLSEIKKSFKYITTDTLPEVIGQACNQEFIMIYKESSFYILLWTLAVIEYGNLVWEPFFNQDISTESWEHSETCNQNCSISCCPAICGETKISKASYHLCFIDVREVIWFLLTNYCTINLTCTQPFSIQQHIPPQGATALNYKNLLQVYSVRETVFQWEWLIIGTTYLMM